MVNNMPTEILSGLWIGSVNDIYNSEFYKDNKRVSNKKIKKSLGVNLNFPTYKHGIDFIFKNIINQQILHYQLLYLQCQACQHQPI